MISSLGLPAPAEAREAATAQAETESPLEREIPLSLLHRRSAPLSIAHDRLSQGLDSARRLDALEWLVQAFDALNLPDAQLFAAFGLLDRFAAASPVAISAGPGAFALVLAAMLVALKVAATKKDLDRAKRLVIEVSGSSRPWTAVRRAEVQILRRLSFRACTPTAYDLLERLLSDCVKATPAGQEGPWDGESKARCGDLARFLLELCVVHEPEAAYGLGRPPMAAALAALLVSLLALNAPKRFAESLESHLQLAELNKATVLEMAECMRSRWSMQEACNSGGGNSGSNSAVTEKWLRRMGSFQVSPPSSGDLRYLTASLNAPSTLKAAEGQSKQSKLPGVGSPVPPATAKGHVGRRASLGAGPATDILAALPTPSRRASLGGDAPLPPAAPAQATPRFQLSEPSEEPSRPGLSQVPRAAAQENVSSWPSSQADAAPGDSPEPLVDLTSVLNMVAPRPQPGGTTASGSGKARPPSVASELLVSSALRMQWPVDKRKVSGKEAANTCREAAAVLQEAVTQLSAAANALEGGSNGMREFMKAKGVADTKRRRTFGGPSPPPGALKASSPSRPSGLRV